MRSPRGAPSRVLFGTIVFLASELLFFGGLFAAYFGLRSHAHHWPPDGAEVEPLVAAIATALLVTSSVTLHLGVVASERERYAARRWWVLATLALGAGFLAIQGWEYTQLPFGIDSHAYGTVFYAMTGFHGAHVLAGLVLIVVLLALTGPTVRPTVRRDAAGSIAAYWHFVDAVWIALFVTLYLVT